MQRDRDVTINLGFFTVTPTVTVVPTIRRKAQINPTLTSQVLPRDHFFKKIKIGIRPEFE